MNYYNENDPKAAAWLRELIKQNCISPGVVDERSIVDVKPNDLTEYKQCHFFAGIGGWSYALRLANWPDARPVWTGSCPCQPFSAAGQGKAGDDERHLWPVWFSLIAERRPTTVFGEQVEAAIGWGWLDVVFADLEAEGYACGATVLPACCVGAPHRRNRVWFVANDQDDGRGKGRAVERGSVSGTDEAKERLRSMQCGDDGHMGVPTGDGCKAGASLHRELHGEGFGEGRESGNVAISDCGRREIADVSIRPTRQDQTPVVERGLRPWDAVQWLPCTDGKARPVEPGTFPLANGIPARVGRLRGYGNAIVPQLAAEFIKAAQYSIT